MRFHTDHLEEFPELLGWLCHYFDKSSNANMGHNDLIELTLNHMKNASLTPEFFFDLANYSMVICKGIEKDITGCEANCDKYDRCSNIAIANNRYKRFEALGICLLMYKNGTCICSQEPLRGNLCPGSLYLNGKWNITDFFTSQYRKEAV